MVDIDQESTIFVSIASYRDPECPRTIQDMFKKARYPGRVHALVNEQNYPEDASSVGFPGSERFSNNIRLLRVSAHDAKGPMVARARIEQELYKKGEADYWLQIDSHMAFVKDWDVLMIQQHGMIPNPDKGILTTYPPDFTQGNRNVPNPSLPTFIGLHDFSTTRLFPQHQRYRYRSFPQKPREAIFYSAGFVFGPGEMVEEVPYDIHGNYLFLGEELSMAARLFTHGYTLYTPVTSLIFHLSSRAYRPTFWEQIHKRQSRVESKTRLLRKSLETNALRRLQDMLLHGKNPTEDGGIYGLGNERTLQEFQDYIGIDLTNGVATPRAKLGIVEDATPEEWIEKHGLPKQKWELAMRALTPLLPPKVI